MCHTLYQIFLGGKRSCDRQYVCKKNKIRKGEGNYAKWASHGVSVARPVIIRRVYQNDLEPDFLVQP